MIKFLDWRALVAAILVAGTAFLATMLLGAPAQLGLSSQIILKYFASLVLGADTLTGEFTLTVGIVGIVVNYAIAAIWGFAIAAVLHRWGMIVGLVLGGLLGLAVFAINMYTMTFIFDWFSAMNNSMLLIAHVVYGVVLGGIYEALDSYDTALPFTQPKGGAA